MKPQFDPIHYPEENSFNIFSYEGNEFEAPWHFHKEYELTYIVKSHGIRYIGNQMFPFSEGELILLGTNIPHCWKNTSYHDGDAKSIVIHWNMERLIENWRNIPEFRKIKKMLEDSSHGIMFEPTIAGKTLEEMERMLLKKSSSSSYFMFLGLLDQLSQSSYSLVSGFSYDQKISTKANDRLDKIQQYLKEHYKDNIKLSEVSNWLNMKEESFSRFFSKYMQKPFFSFLNEYRVNIAKKLLVETNLNITEIGFECGYESLPFFYKQFKKYVGESPLSYRKNYLKNIKFN